MKISNSNKNKDPLPVLLAGTFEAKASTSQLRDSVNRILETLSGQLSEQAITLNVDICDSLRYALNASLFERAVRCLCEQSIHGMPCGGELIITAVEQADGIDLEIADSRNDYIESPRLLDGQSDQTFTELIPVHYFVAVHGGTVRVQNCPEGGVAFTIHLPFSQALRSAA
tara:strand:+ start:301 stop:813 length:513 start_codon:yes stop_codon:yes gene_type:complete